MIKGTYKDCPVCHRFKGNHTRISTHMRRAHGMGLNKWEQNQSKKVTRPAKLGKEALSHGQVTGVADHAVEEMENKRQVLNPQVTEIPVNPTNSPLVDRVRAFMDEALANPEVSEEWKRQIDFRRIQLNRIAQMFPESASH